MSLSAGMMVDRYVTERLLSAGDDAEVWCVRHTLLGSRHALKVLRRTASRSHLLSTVRTQARLDHPNLLPIRDLFSVDGRAGLLMPLIEGPSLRALLARRRLSTDEALRLTAAITAGLAFAHRGGLYHQALCPDNVLLHIHHGQLEPRLINFGLHAATALPSDPRYAPTPRRGDATDDVYALGVILYEMLTGQPPTPPWKTDTLSPPLRALFADLRAPAARRPTSAALLSRLEAISAQVPGVNRGLVRAVRQLEPPPPLAPLETPNTDATANTLATGVTWAPMPSIQHNLNAPRSVFIGRQRELNSLQARLGSERRLVTILGTGGIGKTRLALEAGRTALKRWSGGVWFCELAEAETLPALISAVAQALSVPLGEDPEGQLAAAIAGRGEALFILDNFEQVVTFAPQTVARWLDRAPEARFLVTSREPLRLWGEETFTLGVLDEDDAIELFVARAREAGWSGPLDAEARADIVELIRLLDGLPLAIELAAARSRMLSPKRLKARMAERFRLLKSRSPDFPPRQRTLRATLAWSWDRLNDAERAVLAQCSVFEGGLTLEAAEAIIDPGGDHWVDEVLSELLDKGLLIRGENTTTGTTRLSMLISVQEFVQTQCGEMASAEARHSAYFARMGTADAMAALSTRGGFARGTVLIDERSNLEVAARRALARGDAQTAAQCAIAATYAITRQGPLREGLDLLDQIDASTGMAAETRARLSLARVTVRQRTGHPELGPLFAETLTQARALDDAAVLGSTLALQGMWLIDQGEPDRAEAAINEGLDATDAETTPAERGLLLVARSLLLTHRGQSGLAREAAEEAYQIAHTGGHRLLRARCLGELAKIYRRTNRLDASFRAFQETLSMYVEVGDQFGEGLTLSNMAILFFRMGRVEECGAAFERSAHIARKMGDRKGESVTLGNLGELYFLRGDTDASREAITRALSLAEEINSIPTQIRGLMRLGELNLSNGDLQMAQAYTERALTLAQRTKDRNGEMSCVSRLANLHLCRGDIEQAEALNLAALVLARELNNSYHINHNLAHLGGFYVTVGRFDDALAQHEQALAYAQERNDPDMTGLALSQKGQALFFQGHLGEARALLEQAIKLARSLEDMRSVKEWSAFLGGVYSDQGHADEARAALRESQAIAEHQNDDGYLSETAGRLGMVDLRFGNLAQAREHLERARDIARTRTIPLQLGIWLRALGEVHLRTGALAMATACLDEAAPLLERARRPGSLIELNCVRAEVAAQKGLREQADAWMARAWSHAETMQLGPNALHRQRLEETAQRISAHAARHQG